MGPLEALALIRRYWPLIKMVLAVVKSNTGALDKLRERGGTKWPEDVRDFFREVDKKGKWEPFKKDYFD